LWSRIKKRQDIIYASDRVKTTYEQDRFQTFIIQKAFTNDPEAIRLIEMCEQIKDGKMRLSALSSEDEELLAQYILHVYKI